MPGIVVQVTRDELSRDLSGPVWRLVGPVLRPYTCTLITDLAAFCGSVCVGRVDWPGLDQMFAWETVIIKGRLVPTKGNHVAHSYNKGPVVGGRDKS